MKINLETLEITSFVIPNKDRRGKLPNVPDVKNPVDAATDPNDDCWTAGGCTTSNDPDCHDPNNTVPGAGGPSCSNIYWCTSADPTVNCDGGSDPWDCNSTYHCSNENDCYT